VSTFGIGDTGILHDGSASCHSMNSVEALTETQSSDSNHRKSPTNLIFSWLTAGFLT